MIQQFYSAFVNGIEFNFENYEEIVNTDGACFNIHCSFSCGGEKQEKWEQLYEDTWKETWVSREISLTLSVPHLNISGVFSVTQVTYVGYEDKFVFSVRAKKPNRDGDKIENDY